MTNLEIYYEVHNCKMLIIFEIFKQWKYYLKKNRHFIVVLINHVNLQYFIIIKKLIRCQTKWAEKLTVYNFIIKHYFEKTNSADMFNY